MKLDAGHYVVRRILDAPASHALDFQWHGLVRPVYLTPGNTPRKHEALVAAGLNIYRRIPRHNLRHRFYPEEDAYRCSHELVARGEFSAVTILACSAQDVALTAMVVEVAVEALLAYSARHVGVAAVVVAVVTKAEGHASVVERIGPWRGDLDQCFAHIVHRSGAASAYCSSSACGPKEDPWYPWCPKYRWYDQRPC